MSSFFSAIYKNKIIYLKFTAAEDLVKRNQLVEDPVSLFSRESPHPNVIHILFEFPSEKITESPSTVVGVVQARACVMP